MSRTKRKKLQRFKVHSTKTSIGLNACANKVTAGIIVMHACMLGPDPRSGLGLTSAQLLVS